MSSSEKWVTYWNPRCLHYSADINTPTCSLKFNWSSCELVSLNQRGLFVYESCPHRGRKTSPLLPPHTSTKTGQWPIRKRKDSRLDSPQKKNKWTILCSSMYQAQTPTPQHDRNSARTQMPTPKLELVPSKPFLEFSNRVTSLLCTSWAPVFQLYIFIFKIGG